MEFETDMPSLHRPPKRVPTPNAVPNYPRRRQWIIWFVVGFGGMLAALGLACSHPSGDTRSPAVAAPTQMGTDPGGTSSSPGKHPAGVNSGTDVYPVGGARPALSASPRPK